MFRAILGGFIGIGISQAMGVKSPAGAVMAGAAGSFIARTIFKSPGEVETQAKIKTLWDAHAQKQPLNK
jgi:hypothetical protein